MDRKKSHPVEFRSSLHGLSYDQTKASEPPILYNSSAQGEDASTQLGAATPTYISAKLKAQSDRDSKRDWDLASAATKDSGTSEGSDGQFASSITSAPSVPQIRLENDLLPAQHDVSSASRSSRTSKAQPSTSPVAEEFHGLTLDIPSEGTGDLLPIGNLDFSKRGSMLIDGKKVNGMGNTYGGRLSTTLSGRKPRSSPSLRNRQSAKVLSTDEEMLSQKVRAYYEAGLDIGENAQRTPSLSKKMDLSWHNTLEGLGNSSMPSISRGTSASDVRSQHSGMNSVRDRRASIQREDNELAGGLEDWQDVDNADVDRYGFIITRTSTSASLASTGVNRSDTVRDPHSLQRVATSLHLASEIPRRRGTLHRTPSSAANSRPNTNSLNVSRQPSTRSIGRPTSSQSGYQGNLAGNTSRLRHASNRLPHNKTRRLLDEAADMLTLPPGLQNIPENGQPSLAENQARRKETEREEKWRKMARIVSSNDGGGMVFTFDSTSPKLIERTWKGIPDTWRATAWHAFLSASAKKRPQSLSDEELVASFHEYLEEASPDDVQIDIDVPRTISSHIMFRRRYRGGQRLLFRVLHSMSLHFPETGYVQGMAALAATLLAYYDEERAFVMLVRLWDLRGLDRLYKSGFGGLMEALEDFEQRWLGAGELGGKLDKLGIGPTAYGTRWYLTLFNYSIPFAAQLRVWDVFMLLGDDPSPPDNKPFGTALDVLHATSAALIDGMRDILLESDFENAMKTLTSWVPIRDEDLFMRVARAEWKVHRRK